MAARTPTIGTEPVKLGRTYVVPCIFWPWLDLDASPQWWPVIGHRHTDVEFFGFKPTHYHVDPRFVTKKQRDWASDIMPGKPLEKYCQSAPLSASVFGSVFDVPDKPTMMRRRCTQEFIPYFFHVMGAVTKINNRWKGDVCRGEKGAWICPHQHTRLAGVHADSSGVVTCPLHGMRIDAETGVCVGNQTLSERLESVKRLEEK